MKIKFQVYHTYGLECEQIFSLEELGIKLASIEKINKGDEELNEKIEVKLAEWVEKNYNYGDAIPSWEVVKGN